jgi:hypothetical protein
MRTFIKLAIAAATLAAPLAAHAGKVNTSWYCGNGIICPAGLVCDGSPAGSGYRWCTQTTPDKTPETDGTVNGLETPASTEDQK